MRDSAPLDNLQNLYPVTDLPKKFPLKKGKPLNKSTFIRWATTGVRGKKLRTQVIGNQLFTCDAWVADFLRQDKTIDRESQVQAAVAKAESQGI